MKETNSGIAHRGYHFGVGEFTTRFRTYFSGWIESDFHWGYNLAFDPWPYYLKNIHSEYDRTMLKKRANARVKIVQRVGNKLEP